MQEAVPAGEGAMAAIVGLDAAIVAQACADAAEGEVVSPANLNGAGQVVIAGAREAVKRAGERARALGAKYVIPLAVSAPFHCALMKPAAARLAPELRALVTEPPRVPIVANVDAEPKRDAGAAIEALVQQVSSPVRWEAVVGRLASEGVTTYVEVGSGTVLSGLVRKIHRDATVVSFGTPDDFAAVEKALACLHPGQARGCTARATSSPWSKSAVAPRAAMRPAGKARRPRISGIFEGGATPPGGMQRRPNAGELPPRAAKHVQSRG